MVHPAKWGHRVLAVITFKFDESYNDDIMCVAGWIGEESEWHKLEAAWSNRIARANSRIKTNQQITRFHATEMNCKSGEYENWDRDMCVQFSKRLIGAIAKRRMGGLGVACDMNAIRQVFPSGDEATMKRRMYVLCIKQLMVEVAHRMRELFPGNSVQLVHESGSWNVEALRAYELMVDEEKLWDKASIFSGFTSLTKSQSIGLQACDLFAYEVFKGVSAKTKTPDVALRGAMSEMIERGIPLSARWINLKGAQALYRVMQESGKYPDLDQKGLT